MRKYAVVIPRELGGVWLVRTRSGFHCITLRIHSGFEEEVEEKLIDPKLGNIWLGTSDTLTKLNVLTTNGGRWVREFHIYLLTTDIMGTWRGRLNGSPKLHAPEFVDLWALRLVRLSPRVPKTFEPMIQ